MNANNSSEGDRDVHLFIQTRDYWNQLESDYLLPNTIILAFYLLIGIIGNLTVILIYQIKMRKKEMDGRYFVAPLAWLDLTAVIVTGAFNLTQNTRSVTFPKFGACKMLMYFSYITTCSSLYLLAAVALQRYLKICRPFGKQMSLCWKRISVFSCIVISLIVYLPIPFFYGVVPVHNPELGNITGHKCSVLPVSANRLQHLRIYQGLGFLGTILDVILISILYSLVITAIVKQFRKQNRLRVGPEVSIVVKSDSSSTNMTCLGNSALQSCTNSDLDTTMNSTAKSLNTESKQFPSKQSKQKSTFRISFMFMTISLVGFLAYLPSWVFIIIETNNPTFWKTLPVTTFHVCLTLRRMYMINHIANPFIYGIFDQAFRREISNVFCRN